MLKELRGSDVIIECLLEQGVDTVFGYPGGAVLNIYDSLYKYSDKYQSVVPSVRSEISRLPAMRLTDIQEQQAERVLLSQLQVQVLRTL